MKGLLLMLGFVLVGVAHGAAQSTPVAVAPITQVALAQQLELVGTAIPERIARISAQVDGQISRMLVDEGDRVVANQPLFELDLELARITVQRRSAQLTEAEANQRDAARQLAESRRLREQGHIPNSILEGSITALAVAEALVEQRQADLAEAKALVARHKVVAPFSGSVTRKLTELGQWLARGTAGLELVQTDPLRIEVAVPQLLISAVTPGTSAMVRFDAVPSVMLTVQVAAVIPRQDNNSRTTPVWLSLPNPQGRVLPGMSARVQFQDRNAEALALVVPNDALVRRVDGSTIVWVVSESDTTLSVMPLQVGLGRSNAQFTEIIAPGARLGDRVVVRGNESLRVNQTVIIVEYPAVGR